MVKLRLTLCILVAATFTSIVSPAAFAQEADTPKINVLIISGLNNHNWKETTPKLKSILESTGRFAVEVTEKPYELTADSLAKFDVILSNFNAFGKGTQEKLWTEDVRNAYENFVRSGGGHVVIHAGACSFNDWPEYLEIGLANWKGGQTSHGPQHEFDVRIDDPDHPITKGLEPFKVTDELWNRPGMPEGVTTIASGFSTKESRGTDQWEPVAMVRRFGEGRCYTLMLGHDAKKMEQPPFVTLLTRGVEWAATGAVSSK